MLRQIKVEEKVINMKKGAIFDMDGTLLDTERLYRESWIILAKEYGQTPNPQFPIAVCGSSGEKMVAIIEEYYPQIDAVRFMKDCYKRVEYIVENDVPVKAGTREILEYFRDKGVKMSVASSSSRAQIEKNLKNAGIYEFFEDVVGGDEVEHSKPHPEIFHKAAERMGMSAHECYAFEDGMNGLRAASSSGAETIMIVDMTPANDEAKELCAAIYDNFYDALKGIQDKENR